MEKEKFIIYDDAYFKEATVQDFKGERVGILFETFQNISNKDKKNLYKIQKDEVFLLIKDNKLVVDNTPTLYSNVSEHDKIISFALVKSMEYDVTVYTRNEELAIDLVLNEIKVKTDDYSSNFVNIGKSNDENDIFIYDTCALLFNMEKIDFSKNYHYVPVCVLEELIKTPNTHLNVDVTGSLFKLLYIYNKYPEHVKILNTVSSTQKGGRYSYTDLLILYSTIRLKNELEDSNITLVTNDRQLAFEAMQLKIFDVTSKLRYFEDKNVVEEDICIVLDEKNDEEEESEQDEILDELIDDRGLYEIEEFIESEIYEEVNNESIMSLEQKVINFTKNYKVLPLRKLHRKNVVNLPDVIEHVYNENFRLITPVLRRKLEKGFTAQTYIVKVGFYITFKTNPGVSYRVVGINNLIATLQKI